MGIAPANTFFKLKEVVEVLAKKKMSVKKAAAKKKTGAKSPQSRIRSRIRRCDIL
ncbi:hypothetical protein CHISP_2249 [Chitinispirillum alkaliphilum]|nr:hypothetical protein CHISP_2249 [Chitinispirillum alkaliphilum]